ncbi:hypothetical protein BB558_004151 [Smittium angustum]|uniref:Uncharacterized protein n=1 Tax=Smittium angustum TaxID=133377 RepID=A0A2U1J4E1_SMIAN|nr:hypothetical protein BB558_004151 [Smittium angustum]
MGSTFCIIIMVLCLIFGVSNASIVKFKGKIEYIKSSDSVSAMIYEENTYKLYYNGLYKVVQADIDELQIYPIYKIDSNDELQIYFTKFGYFVNFKGSISGINCFKNREKLDCTSGILADCEKFSKDIEISFDISRSKYNKATRYDKQIYESLKNNSFTCIKQYQPEQDQSSQQYPEQNRFSVQRYGGQSSKTTSDTYQSSGNSPTFIDNKPLDWPYIYASEEKSPHHSEENTHPNQSSEKTGINSGPNEFQINAVSNQNVPNNNLETVVANNPFETPMDIKDPVQSSNFGISNNYPYEYNPNLPDSTSDYTSEYNLNQPGTSNNNPYDTNPHQPETYNNSPHSANTYQGINRYQNTIDRQNAQTFDFINQVINNQDQTTRTYYQNVGIQDTLNAHKNNNNPINFDTPQDTSTSNSQIPSNQGMSRSSYPYTPPNQQPQKTFSQSTFPQPQPNQPPPQYEQKGVSQGIPRPPYPYTLPNQQPQKTFPQSTFPQPQPNQPPPQYEQKGVSQGMSRPPYSYPLPNQQQQQTFSKPSYPISQPQPNQPLPPFNQIKPVKAKPNFPHPPSGLQPQQPFSQSPYHNSQHPYPSSQHQSDQPLPSFDQIKPVKAKPNFSPPPSRLQPQRPSSQPPHSSSQHQSDQPLPPIVETQPPNVMFKPPLPPRPRFEVPLRQPTFPFPQPQSDQSPPQYEQKGVYEVSKPPIPPRPKNLFPSSQPQPHKRPSYEEIHSSKVISNQNPSEIQPEQPITKSKVSFSESQPKNFAPPRPPTPYFRPRKSHPQQSKPQSHQQQQPFFQRQVPFLEPQPKSFVPPRPLTPYPRSKKSHIQQSKSQPQRNKRGVSQRHIGIGSSQQQYNRHKDINQNL